ncbi:MAG: hypothetical protein LBF78_00040 [Treponema sp.]|nr:hypothetical protein [Treponema sp.]
MDGEGVKTLERIIDQSMFIDVEGLKFGRDANGNIKPIFYEPRPDKIGLHTLTGFADYIKANVDKLELKNHIIVVENPGEVSLYSTLNGKDRDRDLIAVATPDQGLQSYHFGKYQEVEEFIISLNSLFEESKDRERVINYVSRVTGGTGFTLADDGVTQIAEVTKGISGAITQKESAPKIVALKPYRTFRDVEQPASDFLLRLKLFKPEENIVGVCLYEADGGRWRNTAVQTIKEFLNKELGELEVAIIA